MQRVLDVDLDFFVHGVASYRDLEAGRLDGDEYPPWTTDAAMSFLSERCGLDGPPLCIGCTADHVASWTSTTAKYAMLATARTPRTAFSCPVTHGKSPSLARFCMVGFGTSPSKMS